MEQLFRPLPLGPFILANRIVMAPLTRCRATIDHVPTPLMATYYQQRASAGLIIAEATMVSEGTSTFQTEPGIYNRAQVTAWRDITGAVHDQEGRIFVQLWHGGRACHPLMNHGIQPVSASPIAITSDLAHTAEGKKPYAVPRALEDIELSHIVQDFRNAAANALEAGFDGVEIHGANGYLLDQFLRDGCNQRSGTYGGSFENRARLLFEVLEAVSEVWGSDRVGVRLSPLSSFNSMGERDPIGLAAWLGHRLNGFNLAYVHLIRGDVLGSLRGDVLAPMRNEYKGTLICNLRYSPIEADTAISKGEIDAVAFGTSYIANPDLVERIRAGGPFNTANPSTFYKPGPIGYTDYQTLAKEEGYGPGQGITQPAVP